MGNGLAVKFPTMKPIALFLAALSLTFLFLRLQGLPFGFDDSVNMHTSVSLSESFVYQRTFRPAQIYAPSTTTNGPVQYLMAASLKFLPLYDARTLTLLLMFTAFLAGLYLHSSWATAFFVILLPFWPKYLYCADTFVGELTAITFCLFALRARARPAAILFGLAIATKFLTIFLVPFLLLTTPTKKRTRIFLGALAVFLVSYYFSVAHSFLALKINPIENPFAQPSWGGIWEFIRTHFEAERTAPTPTRVPWQIIESNPWLTPLFLACALTAARKNRATLALSLGTVLLFFFANLNERRLFPFLFFVFFFGALAFRRNKLLISAAFLISLVGSQSLAQGFIEETWRYRHRTDPAAKLAYGFGRLPDFVRHAQYPIVVSSWWHMPELSLQTGTHFYDRMAPENENLMKAHEKVYLLIRGPQWDYWPYTTPKFCGKVLLEEERFVFCEFKKGVALRKGGPDPDRD